MQYLLCQHPSLVDLVPELLVVDITNSGGGVGESTVVTGEGMAIGEKERAEEKILARAQYSMRLLVQVLVNASQLTAHLAHHPSAAQLLLSNCACHQGGSAGDHQSDSTLQRIMQLAYAAAGADGVVGGRFSKDGALPQYVNQHNRILLARNVAWILTLLCHNDEAGAAAANAAEATMDTLLEGAAAGSVDGAVVGGGEMGDGSDRPDGGCSSMVLRSKVISTLLHMCGVVTADRSEYVPAKKAAAAAAAAMTSEAEAAAVTDAVPLAGLAEGAAQLVCTLLRTYTAALGQAERRGRLDKQGKQSKRGEDGKDAVFQIVEHGAIKLFAALCLPSHMPQHKGSMQLFSMHEGVPEAKGGVTMQGTAHGHGLDLHRDALWRHLTAKDWATNANLAAQGVLLIVQSGCVSSLVALVKQKALHAMIGQLSACANHLPHDQYGVLREIGHAVHASVAAICHNKALASNPMRVVHADQRKIFVQSKGLKADASTSFGSQLVDADDLLCALCWGQQSSYDGGHAAGGLVRALSCLCTSIRRGFHSSGYGGKVRPRGKQRGGQGERNKGRTVARRPNSRGKSTGDGILSSAAAILACISHFVHMQARKGWGKGTNSRGGLAMPLYNTIVKHNQQDGGIHTLVRLCRRYYVAASGGGDGSSSSSRQDSSSSRQDYQGGTVQDTGQVVVHCANAIEEICKAETYYSKQTDSADVLIASKPQMQERRKKRRRGDEVGGVAATVAKEYVGRATEMLTAEELLAKESAVPVLLRIFYSTLEQQMQHQHHADDGGKQGGALPTPALTLQLLRGVVRCLSQLLRSETVLRALVSAKSVWPWAAPHTQRHLLDRLKNAVGRASEARGTHNESSDGARTGEDEDTVSFAQGIDGVARLMMVACSLVNDAMVIGWCALCLHLIVQKRDRVLESVANVGDVEASAGCLNGAAQANAEYVDEREGSAGRAEHAGVVVLMDMGAAQHMAIAIEQQLRSLARGFERVARDADRYDEAATDEDGAGGAIAETAVLPRSRERKLNFILQHSDRMFALANGAGVLDSFGKHKDSAVHIAEHLTSTFFWSFGAFATASSTIAGYQQRSSSHVLGTAMQLLTCLLRLTLIPPAAASALPASAVLNTSKAMRCASKLMQVLDSLGSACARILRSKAGSTVMMATTASSTQGEDGSGARGSAGSGILEQLLGTLDAVRQLQRIKIRAMAQARRQRARREGGESSVRGEEHGKNMIADAQVLLARCAKCVYYILRYGARGGRSQVVCGDNHDELALVITPMLPRIKRCMLECSTDATHGSIADATGNFACVKARRSTARYTSKALARIPENILAEEVVVVEEEEEEEEAGQQHQQQQQQEEEEEEGEEEDEHEIRRGVRRRVGVRQEAGVRRRAGVRQKAGVRRRAGVDDASSGDEVGDESRVDVERCRADGEGRADAIPGPCTPPMGGAKADADDDTVQLVLDESAVKLLESGALDSPAAVSHAQMPEALRSPPPINGEVAKPAFRVIGSSSEGEDSSGSGSSEEDDGPMRPRSRRSERLLDIYDKA
jgi:hypothetical protein